MSIHCMLQVFNGDIIEHKIFKLFKQKSKVSTIKPVLSKRADNLFSYHSFIWFQVLARGQRYKVSLVLHVPYSEDNKKVGKSESIIVIALYIHH